MKSHYYERKGKAMKKLLFMLIALFLLASSCTGGRTMTTQVLSRKSDETIQALEQPSVLASTIPTLTLTPTPTATPIPTFTSTPSPIFDKDEKTIEGFLNDWGTIYSFPIIQLTKIKLIPGFSFYEPKAGYGYLRIHLIMKNQGDTIAELGSKYFVVVDKNGVLYEPAALDTSCEVKYVAEVMPKGKIEGCAYFEVPFDDEYTLYYAPYEMGRFEPDRSLKWEISGLQ
jgi:hypothetical protein